MRTSALERLRSLSLLRKTPLHPQWLIFRRSRKSLVEAIENCDGRILDIGCADCWPRQHLQRSHQYVGVDYAKTAERYGFKPDVFGDARSLPFCSNSFDYLFAFDVLEHVADIDDCVAEISRVLIPGGCALVQIPFAYPLHDEPYDFQRLTEHGLRRLAERAGLEVVDLKAVGHPVETACATAAMACALAVQALLSPARRLALVLLVPVLMILMVVFNLIGRVAALLPSSNALPMRYFVKMAKPG